MVSVNVLSPLRTKWPATALFLIAATVLTLTACGGGSGSSDGNGLDGESFAGTVAALITAAQLSGVDLLSLTDAAHETPGRPTVRTVWRWSSRGVRGVRLQTLKVGGRTYTSREALQRFLVELNEQPRQC